MDIYQIFQHKIFKISLLVLLSFILCSCSAGKIQFEIIDSDHNTKTVSLSKDESSEISVLLENCAKEKHPYYEGALTGTPFYTFKDDKMSLSGDWIDCIINIDGTWYLCDPMDPMFDYIRDLSVKYGNTWYLSKDIIQVLSELNPFPTVWGAYKNFLQLKVSDKTELNYMMSYFNKDNSDNKLLGEVIKDVKMNEEYTLDGIRIKVISCSDDTFIAIAELSE